MAQRLSKGNGASEQVDQMLFLEQVRSIVTSAAQTGGTLRISPHVKQLAQSKEAAELSPRSIADALIRAAAAAGVPVEMDHCSE